MPLQSRGGRRHLHGQMGHKIRVLEIGRRRRCRMEFSHVLPQHPGQPCYLVVPTSLQMGLAEPPPFFCAASETARDVTQDYCETKLGTLPPHKFTNYVMGNQDYKDLPERDELVKFF